MKLRPPIGVVVVVRACSSGANFSSLGFLGGRRKVAKNILEYT